MYKKITQYLGASTMLGLAALFLHTSTMAAYYPMQSQSTPYAPVQCQDGGTKFRNVRYYQGTTFYPYDTMYGTTTIGWAIDRAASMIYVYNPLNTFSIQGPSGGFVAKSNSKPKNISEVLAAANDSGSVANGIMPSSATTLGMQVIYNISRRPLLAGTNPSWAGGQYIEALANGTFGPMTSWTWQNWAYGSEQEGYECANYYVSRCGDGIKDNGGPVGSGVALVDAYGYPLWTNGNTPNGGEQCDLGAQNGQPGSACTASCQNAPIPQNPDVTIAKAVSGAVSGYLSGGVVRYTIVYNNIGTGLATNVSIVDQLPAGVSYVPGSVTTTPNIGQPTVNGNLLTWNLATLAAGSGGTITFQVNITQFNACMPYTNTIAIAATNEPANMTGNNTSSAQFTTACPNPDVLTTKTVTAISGSYMPGQTVAYTLHYANIGQGAASGVILTDTLPAQVTYSFMGASNPVLPVPTVTTSGTQQVLTRNLGTLAPNASGNIVVYATINAATPTCTNLSIINNLTISATNESPTLLGNNPSSASFPMQCIDLWSQKTVNHAVVQSGSQVVYTITYGNSGNMAVQAGQLVDVLPIGMNYVPGSATSTPSIGQPVVGTSGGQQTLTWAVGPLAAGFQGTVQVSATVQQATQNQQYINTVCITGDGVNPATGTGYFNNNNCGQAVSVASIAFDLSIEKTPHMLNVVMNQEFDYTLTVSNAGPESVQGFTVNDYLPVGLQYVSSTPNGSYNTTTHTVTWTGLSLSAQAGMQLIVRVKYVGPVSLGAQTNWTEICHYNGIGTGNGQNPANPNDIDSNPCNGTGNNEDDVSSGVVIPQTGANYDLAIVKTPAHQMAYSGEQVTFTLAVTNQGNTGVQNFSVNDYLPAGLMYVSSTPTAIYNATTQTLTWDGLDLEAGGSLDLQVVATYTATGTVVNWTEICSYTGVGTGGLVVNPHDIDSNPCNGTGNNEDDVSSGAVSPEVIDLNIQKLVNGQHEIYAVTGQIVQFTLIVGNSGNVAVSGFTVNDYLPAGFIFLQASNGGVYNATAAQSSGGTITWTGLQSLAPGATMTLSFSAQYVDTVTRTNYAEICAYHGMTTNQSQQQTGPADIDSNPCNNGATTPEEDDEAFALVHPNTGLYDLSLTKLINGTSYAVVSSGQVVTVTLQVTNSGAVGVTNFSVKDYMPVGLQYVAGSANPATATYDSTGRVITFSGLNIAATGTLTLTFQATYMDSVPRINYAEICGYNGIGSGYGQTAGTPYDIDSNPCNNGANVPIQDDEASAQLGPGGGPGGTTMDIQLTKLVNNVSSYQANNGETVTFTLRVSNEGNTAPGAPITVVDYLPTNVNYVANSALPNTSPVSVTYDSATRKLTWSGIVLGANDYKLLTFQAIYTDSVSRTNYAEVCGYNGHGTASGNNQSGLPTNAVTNPQDVDSDPCDNGANAPTEDDEAQAIITPKGGGYSGGGNHCGDGVIARPNSDGQREECDLGTGNGQAGYNCTADCKTKTVVGSCGNNVLDAGEMCDEGTAGGHIDAGVYSGKRCTAACTVQGVIRQSPQCAYIDPPSIQQGEYLPYRWDIESNISVVSSVASCVRAGQILKDSLTCDFTITNARGDTVDAWTKPCSQKDTTPLWTSAHTQAMSSMGYGNDIQPPLYGWSSRKSPVSLSWLGEHKVSMKVIGFKTCSKNTEGEWEALANINTNQRVCEMNFVVTKPYMVSRGPLGNFTTDGLDTFLQLPDGAKIFSQPRPSLTQKFDVTQEAKDAVAKLVASYDKLAVAAGTLPGTDAVLKKVPGKDIYVVDADGQDIAIGDNSNNATSTKPFTLIVKNGSLVVKGNLTAATKGMYIVPDGNITFSMEDCRSKQSVQGIFITLKNILSLDPWAYGISVKNTDANRGEWCSAGDLTITGVLIGNGVSAMTEMRRSNINNRFFDMASTTQQSERQENMLSRGAVVLEYNPSLFDNLPPGADVLGQVLQVYKK